MEVNGEVVITFNVTEARLSCRAGEHLGQQRASRDDVRAGPPAS
jgi:hypothetical protein